MRSLKLWLIAGALLAGVPASATALLLAADVAPELVPALERPLRSGDRGPAVTALQELLSAQGFDPGPPDGVFGPRTEAAVRLAQERYGLTVDGLAGPLTVGALGLQGGDTPPLTGDPGDRGLKRDTLVYHEALPAAGRMGTRAARSGSAAPAPVPVRSHYALTFNGIPDRRILPDLLAALRTQQARATFFISGEVAERSPKLVSLIAQDGHEVANAGYVNLDMTRLTRSMIRSQILQTQKALMAVTGYAPRYFRPPQGRFNAEVAAQAEELGLELVLWHNVAARHGAGLPSGRLRALLKDLAFPGAVLMLHQDRPGVNQLVTGVVGDLTDKGMGSLTLTELRQTGPVRQSPTVIDGYCGTCRSDGAVSGRNEYLLSQRMQ